MLGQLFSGAGSPSGGARYVDPLSGEQHDLDVARWRADSGRPLLITPGRGLGPADIEQGERSLWRYRRALALDIASPITLGEGCTPLRAGVWGGASPLFKLEWFSPTGSFKDRGASVMLSALRQQGIRAVLEDSSGNGGAAVAAYAAAGGLDATVFAPERTSPAKLVQARAHGARVELVPGPREASQQAAIAAAAEPSATGAGDPRSVFYASHNWQAFFLEGTKTLAYELWEDLGFRAPDNVIVPVGAGSSLLGLALGFGELLGAGQIDRLPRLFAAQPLHCSPVDAAFRGEPPESRAVLPTIAEGTAIRSPLRLPEMLAALRVSDGGTVAVPEAGIAGASARLSRLGLFAEPTSATAAAALDTLLGSGTIDANETTVVVLTGSGLKSPPR